MIKSLRLKCLSLGLKFMVPSPMSGIGLPSLRQTMGFVSMESAYLKYQCYIFQWLIMMIDVDKVQNEILNTNIRDRRVQISVYQKQCAMYINVWDILNLNKSRSVVQVCGCCKNAGKIQFPSYIQQMRPKTNNPGRSTYRLNMHQQLSEQSDSSDPDTWELPEHNIKFKTHSINQIRQRRRQLAEMENNLKKPNLQQSVASNIMQTANQEGHTDNKQMKVYIQRQQNAQNLIKSNREQVSEQQQQPMSNAQINQAEPYFTPHFVNSNQVPSNSVNNLSNEQDYIDGTHLRRLFHSHQPCKQYQQPISDDKQPVEERIQEQQKQMCIQENQLLQPQQVNDGQIQRREQKQKQKQKQKQIQFRIEQQQGNGNQVQMQSMDRNKECIQQIDVQSQRQQENRCVVDEHNENICNSQVLVRVQAQSQWRQPQTEKQQNEQNKQNNNSSMQAQCQKQQLPLPWLQECGNKKSQHNMRQFWIQIKPIALNESKQANQQLVVVDDSNIEGQSQQRQASFHNSYHSCHSASIDIAQFLIQPKHIPDQQSGQCQQQKSSVQECQLQQDSIPNNIVPTQSRQQDREYKHRSEICQQQAQIRQLKQKREAEEVGACQMGTIKQPSLSAAEQQQLSESLANYKLTREDILNGMLKQASYIQQKIANQLPLLNKQCIQQQSQSQLQPESQTNINSHTQKPKFELEQSQPQHQDQKSGKHEVVIEKQAPTPKITLSNALPMLFHDKKKQIQLKKQIKSARKSTHPPKLMQSSSKPTLVNLKLMKNIIVIDDESISGADSVIEIANVDTNTRSKDRQEGQISDHQDQRQGEQLDERKVAEKMKIQQIRRRLCAAINQQPRQSNDHKKDPRLERRKQKLATTVEQDNQKLKKQAERQKQKLKNKQKQKYKQC